MFHRSSVSDVAEAVALRQEVDWKRCAEHARPAERGALEHLRTVARICRASEVRVGTSETAARRDRPGHRFVRRAVGLLVGVALVQSIVGLATGVALLPAATDGMLAALGGLGASGGNGVSPTGFLPVSDMTPSSVVFRLVPHVLYPVCGLFLFVSGGSDRRARLLGAVFVLLGAFWAQPGVRGFGVGLYPELFLPAVLWMFVREFPRVRRRTRLDDGARYMAGVSAVVGSALQAVNLSPVQSLSPALAVLARDVPGTYVAPAFFGPYCVFVLTALAVLVLRALSVSQGERVRTWVFVGGIVAALAPHVEGVVEVAFPGTVTVAAANWVSVLGSVAAVAVPCLTMYAAIALRVLDVRTTVRVSARRLLTRGGLALFTIGPLAALGALITSRVAQPADEVLADPLALSCLGCAAVSLVALAFRERLLARLDAWIAPETADQRRALASAGTDLGLARRAAEVEAVAARAARRGAGVPANLLVPVEASGAGGHRLVAPGASIASLPGTSTIVQVLEEVHTPLVVHPDQRSTVFDLLPADEAAWVMTTGAAVVVRVAGPGVTTSGVLVAGPRADTGRLRPVDVTFLEALAAIVGLALGRLPKPAGTPDASESGPALLCQACGLVAAAPDAAERCGACGGPWATAPIPALLAGKFLFERRVGAGGMGAVYRARDIGLDRPVAMKTFEGVSPERLARLKPEAQAMAALVHPGIAQIYGFEIWQGRPLLVMEYLDGGTLAARVAEGPGTVTGCDPGDSGGGRGAGGTARCRLPPWRRETKQYRVHGRRGGEVIGLWLGGPDGRRQAADRRYRGVPVAGGRQRRPGRRCRRCLGACGSVVRDGRRPAAVRRIDGRRSGG